MDPEKTLKIAEGLYLDHELDEASSMLASYWTWRRSGGFEPAGGDASARNLEAAINRARNPRRRY